MIFVTVGNATQPFTRLLEAIDVLAGQGLFHGEKVFMQTGNASTFQARHCETESFLSMDQCLRRLQEASIVISHGGCGTLLQAMGLGKIPIVMPRLSRYHEHVNDHQLQLVYALAAEGRIIPVYEVGNLPDAIEEVSKRNPEPAPKGPMLNLVGQAVKSLIFL